MRNSRITLLDFLLFCACALIAHGPANAATCAVGTSGVAPSAQLSFVAPTTNTDGTPVAAPLTFTLYQGATSGSEVKVASGITGSPITVNTGLADSTTAYWYITVTDAKGGVSANSNEVCKTFPAGVPNTVTITVT